MRRSYWMMLIVAVAAPVPAAAEETGYPAASLPVIRVDVPPVLDGVLDDACWAVAPKVDAFVWPRENLPASQRTEAWMCVDDRFFHVAIYAHDSAPERIFAQQTQRGGGMRQDDTVSVTIDPDANQDDAYTFTVNPLGTQNDQIPQSGSGNIVWRGDWDAGAQRVADGFIVEMSIPFSIFVHQKTQTAVTVAFGRNIERFEESLVWPPMRDRFEGRFMARMEPLELPDVPNRPTILPYVIARAGEDDNATIQSGLDVKHVFSSGMTGLFTLNPDFRNIEDVVESIAFTDTERFLDETRPFFGEGNDFLPGSLHTRRIPDVTAGLKTFGRIGDHSLGVLGVLSDEGRLDGAAQYRYHFNPYVGASVGVVHTDRDDAPTNSVTSLGVGGWHPMGKQSLWWGGGLNHSFTNGPGGEGNALSVNVGLGGEEGFEANVGYGLVTPEFTNLDGFVPENDSRGFNVGVGWNERTKTAFLERLELSVNHGQTERRDGSLLSMGYGTRGEIRFRNGTEFNLGWFSQNRPPNRDRTASAGFRWGLDSLHNGGGVSVSWGDRGGAEQLFVSFGQGWAPIPKLRFNWSFEYSQRVALRPGVPVGNRTQNVLTGTWEFSRFSSASLRMVERDGDVNLFVAYRLQPRNGRTVFFMFGDPNTAKTTAQFQAKLVWPL